MCNIHFNYAIIPNVGETQTQIEIVDEVVQSHLDKHPLESVGSALQLGNPTKSI